MSKWRTHLYLGSNQMHQNVTKSVRQSGPSGRVSWVMNSFRRSLIRGEADILFDNLKLLFVHFLVNASFFISTDLVINANKNDFSAVFPSTDCSIHQGSMDQQFVHSPLRWNKCTSHLSWIRLYFRNIHLWELFNLSYGPKYREFSPAIHSNQHTDL